MRSPKLAVAAQSFAPAAVATGGCRFGMTMARPKRRAVKPTTAAIATITHNGSRNFVVYNLDSDLEHIDLEPPAINARNACELLGLIELD